MNSGIDAKKIFVTGNTVIDSLLYVSNQLEVRKFDKDENSEIILATVHRRENWGEPLANICDGLKMILEKHQNIIIVIPMHPNKDVRKIIKEKLSKFSRVKLLDSLPYNDLVHLIKNQVHLK